MLEHKLNVKPPPPKLYKYIPEKYVDDFVYSGIVLFRSLSYFRDYEDAQVRGDEFEGTRIYRPKAGLEITITETQEKRVIPYSFDSTANEKDIFVFCLSSVLSTELAKQFQVDACVEILKPDFFIGRIKEAISRRPSIKDKTLFHDKVKYYALEDPPIVDWALPEKIAMSKLKRFDSQQEYRITFATNDAFRVENTKLSLVSSSNQNKIPRITLHQEKRLKLGSLAKLCKLHRFD